MILSLQCTYKDLSTTPTSSRKYTNSRLSKSTAKLNLGSSLASATATACPQHKLKSTSSSSVIVEPSGSSNASTSTTSNRSDVYTNTNSNDNVLTTSSSSSSSSSTSSTSSADKESVAPMLAASFSSVGSQTSQDGGGCSRTSGTSAGAAPVDLDAQPSTSSTSTTSSGRCHYAAASTATTSKIVARQVNASAQTQERFLARSGLTGTGGAGGAGLGAIAAAAIAAGGAGLGNAVVRPRRRVEATRSANSDVIVLEVVVEENGNNNGNGNGGNAANAAAAPAGASGAGGNNNDAANMVEPGDFNAEEPWGNCDEENNCSDLEEICTCQNSMLANSRSGSNASLSETLDMDATDGYHQQSVAALPAEESSSLATVSTPFSSQQQQRKRKYNEGRLLDGEYSISATGSGGAGGSSSGAGVGAGNAEAGDNSRKRIAYDFTSTPRSSTQTLGSSVMLSMTPTSSANLGITHGLLGLGSSPALGRRTPRSLMPTHDNPPPELQHWLGQFQRWSHAERLVAVDRLIDNCDPSQVRHMMKVIEPQFQRDFISLLPRELALFVLSYLEPKDLLRAAQTCRSWRFLCDDNLLWKEKCRKAQILTESRSDRPKRGRDGNMPPIASPWKAAYMRQHIIEMNWRSRPVRKPKVLKGHDDHVITCLQFSGNRIVSGSDDNTLKVWSAVNGKVSEGRRMERTYLDLAQGGGTTIQSSPELS